MILIERILKVLFFKTSWKKSNNENVQYFLPVSLFKPSDIALESGLNSRSFFVFNFAKICVEFVLKVHWLPIWGDFRGCCVFTHSPYHHTDSHLKAKLCIAICIKDVSPASSALVSIEPPLSAVSLIIHSFIPLSVGLFQTLKLELVIFYPTLHTSPLTLTRTRLLSSRSLSSSFTFPN